MNIKSLIAVTTAALLTINIAHAADIYQNQSADPVPDISSDRVGKAFYLDVSGGPTVLMLRMNDSTVDSLIANTYWGIGGNAGICAAGVGSDWLDLCGGVTGFASLDSGMNNIAASLGGGTSETDIRSVGGYVQAKMNWGAFQLGPFAGYRHASGSIVLSGAGTTTPINTNAYFGGLETSWQFWGDHAAVGSRAEYGRSTGSNATDQFDYGMVSAFVRVSF